MKKTLFVESIWKTHQCEMQHVRPSHGISADWEAERGVVAGAQELWLRSSFS